VQALDGLPLALELAAARWELMGTAELLRRVSASPAVLADPGQADPRHATLRRAIGWSWALLDAGDQRALQALAVFRDPFALDDAEALVGPGALDRLALLRDSGLVQVASPGRFRLLTSIRAFVRDQTPEPLRLALAEAHATWLVARCADLDAGPSVGGVRGEVAAAARFLVERDDPRALHVLELLDIASPGQHLGLFDAVIARRDSAGARLVRSRALRATGRGAEALDDVAAGLAMDPDPRTHAMLELMVGAVTYERGDLQASLAGFERALALARASGNRRAEALAVCSLAVIDSDQGRLESSERRYEAALDGFRAVGDLRHEATTLLYLGLLRHEQGLLEPAEAAYRDAIDRMTRNGDRLLAFAEGTLGVLCHEAGRLEEARTLHQRACGRVATSTAGRSRSLALARLAAVEAALGDLGSAREHLREASAPSGLDEATRGFVCLAEAFVALVEGRDDEVSRLAREVGHRTGGRTDARIGLRILRRGTASGDAPLVVGDDWFEPPGGARAGLRRHASLLRMFHALVDAREAGVSLDVRGLFDAGWPGQRISSASERNRVHVNLAKLRTLGLREVILREGDGYRLDPAVPIVRRR
jgi:tetratricopeptide (TPR) repeat protein